MEDEEFFDDNETSDETDAEMGTDGDDVASDFSITSKINTAPVETELMGRARARSMTTDQAMLEGTEIAQTLIGAFGDTDEQIARMGQDLLSIFHLINLEFHRKPGRVLVRVIDAEENFDQKLRMIHEARESLDLLELRLHSKSSQHT